MTLIKCFTDIFSPTMKQAGFTKSGLLYYRMHGNMLQGVFLKTCNPFQICFASIPYWMYNTMAYPDIKKGWWTQEGGFNPRGFINKQIALTGLGVYPTKFINSRFEKSLKERLND